MSTVRAVAVERKLVSERLLDGLRNADIVIAGPWKRTQRPSHLGDVSTILVFAVAPRSRIADLRSFRNFVRSLTDGLIPVERNMPLESFARKGGEVFRCILSFPERVLSSKSVAADQMSLFGSVKPRRPVARLSEMVTRVRFYSDPDLGLFKKSDAELYEERRVSLRGAMRGRRNRVV